MRDFVRAHPDYKQDSVVSESINYDLLRRCDDITQGRVIEPRLIGAHQSKTTVGLPSAMEKADTLMQERAAVKGKP